jgi:UDP-3-O-[3-hydroxymyristoyl] glucosamine N-acyltransferase
VTAPNDSNEVTSGEGVRTLTASAIAELVGGSVIGNERAEVRALAPLDRATEYDLSFLANARYASLYEKTRASTVLVAPEFAELATTAAARILVAKPHDAMLTVLPKLYRAPKREPGVHPTARIGRAVTLGDDVTVGPYVVLGDGATLGDRSWIESHSVVGAGGRLGSDVHLYPGVTIYSGTTLGNRVLVHAGARLGSDGFGYVFRNGIHDKIPHIGRCIVDDDVEIGANTTIDRGSFDDTVIGAGTKIDNLVHIAHNVRIGRLCLIMAQVGIAGSVRVGDGVILAGQVGLSGHLTVGDRARLAAQAGVFGDIPAGETWSGYPARPHRESLRASAALFRLADIIKKLERMVNKE